MQVDGCTCSEDRNQDAGILCAQLAVSSVGACRVRIARSTWVRPTFETLTISVPSGDAAAASIVLPPQQVRIPSRFSHSVVLISDCSLWWQTMLIISVEGSTLYVAQLVILSSDGSLVCSS